VADTYDRCQSVCYCEFTACLVEVAWVTDETTPFCLSFFYPLFLPVTIPFDAWLVLPFDDSRSHFVSNYLSVLEIEATTELYFSPLTRYTLYAQPIVLSSTNSYTNQILHHYQKCSALFVISLSPILHLRSLFLLFNQSASFTACRGTT
jgi:hypothetical protein